MLEKAGFKAAQAIVALVLASIASLASAQTAVWQVSKDDGNHIYLGGTIHLLRASDYPLPPEYELAYQKSDRLFFETDIGAMNDPSLQQRMMAQMTYQDGRTLRTVLNEEAYQALSDYVASAGLPIPLAMMQTFKPGLLISTLSVLELQKLGFSPQGVDMFFHTRAMGDGKDRGQLETLDQQLALLASLGDGYESDYVMYSLEDFKDMESQLETMVSSWRAGDLSVLEEQFVGSMGEFSDELYQGLLVDRNQDWLPLIEAMFEQEGTEFVLAGVAHMVGEDGLLAMLESRGYEVTQVMAQP